MAAFPVYATVAQFRLQAPSAAAFTNLPDAVIAAQLARRSRWLDGYLIRKFVLPLVAWQEDLTGFVIDAAAYDCIVTRGFNPDNPTDVNLRLRFEDAVKWATSIPLATTPMVTDSSGSTVPGTNVLTPTVSSASQRGFSSRPTQPTFPPAAGDYIGD